MEVYQNTQVSETKEFISRFCLISVNPDFFGQKIPVMCYRGSQKKPSWIDSDPGKYAFFEIQRLIYLFLAANFTTLCEMQVDLSEIPKITKRNAGKTYYTIEYDLVLVFGLTEFQAQVRWLENVGIP